MWGFILPQMRIFMRMVDPICHLAPAWQQVASSLCQQLAVRAEANHIRFSLSWHSIISSVAVQVTCPACLMAQHYMGVLASCLSSGHLDLYPMVEWGSCTQH